MTRSEERHPLWLPGGSAARQNPPRLGINPTLTFGLERRGSATRATWGEGGQATGVDPSQVPGHPQKHSPEISPAVGCDSKGKFVAEATSTCASSMSGFLVKTAQTNRYLPRVVHKLRLHLTVLLCQPSRKPLHCPSSFNGKYHQMDRPPQKSRRSHPCRRPVRGCPGAHLGGPKHSMCQSS